MRQSDGALLGADKVVNFRAVPEAQALKMTPTGSLDDLGQNITVIFNTPMVPMTNLEERDKLPCPFTITPKLEGKCIWTNTSVLEFIPTKHLE